jgi:hypothetical protein
VTNRIPLDKRVWPGLIFLSILIIAERVWPIPYAVPVLVFLFVAQLLFFRDPQREPPREQGLLAPAYLSFDL